MCCLFARSYRGNSYHLELKCMVVKTMQDAQGSETSEILTEWIFMAQSHRCVVVPSQRKSIIHEGDEIKVVLTRLIGADNLCCSTLMNGGFLCIYSLLSSIETIYLLSGTSCQDVDFFLSDFHDVGLVLTSKIWYNIFENLTQEWINFMELRLCVYTPSVRLWR